VAIVCSLVLLLVVRFKTLSLQDSHFAKKEKPMIKQKLKTIVISILDFVYGLGTNVVASALLARAH